MSQNLQNFIKFQKFQLENLVDFERCCKTHIFLQKSEPIQPKTSNILPKFCQPTLSDSVSPAARHRAAPQRRRRPRCSRPLPVCFLLFCLVCESYSNSRYKLFQWFSRSHLCRRKNKIVKNSRTESDGRSLCTLLDLCVSCVEVHQMFLSCFSEFLKFSEMLMRVIYSVT